MKQDYPQLVCFETRHAPFVEYFRNSVKMNGLPLLMLSSSEGGLSKFQKFKSVYKHLSCNPRDFELACFQRYFEAEAVVPRGSHCFIVDSDQLVFSRPDERLGFSLDRVHVVGSVGINPTTGLVEDDISPHFSYWPHSVLAQFTDYLIMYYSEKLGDLYSEYAQRRAATPFPSVSDMTLLGKFVRDANLPFIDSNSIVNRRYLDHNVSTVRCRNGEFESELGFKRIWHDNGSFFGLVEDSAVQFATLHLQGRAKMVSRLLYERRMLRARFTLGTLGFSKMLRALVK
jgi:hypothetical protein